MTQTVHEFAPFHKVLLPFLPGGALDASLAAALRITEAQNVLLLGLVAMSPEEPLAFGMLAARELRTTLRRLSGRRAPNVRMRVRVTHTPWREIADRVAHEQADLMVIPYPAPFGPEPPEDLPAGLARPPCDVALVHGALPDPVRRILVPARGGPYAELSVRVALAVAQGTGAEVTVLHVRPPAAAGDAARRGDAPYGDLAGVLDRLPGVTLREIETGDPAGAILEAARDADLVVVGSSSRFRGSLGTVAERLVRESPASVIAVRSRHAVPAEPTDPAMAQGAITLLVDRWLAENTYHADEFADPDELLALKARRAMTVSLVLPAFNHEASIGKVIRAIKPALFDRARLLDEIVLVDGGSTDRTCEIAADLGVPAYTQQDILAAYGALDGRGEALWKSLFLTSGDVVLWIDPGAANVHPRAVYGLLGPLLTDPRVQLVNGFVRGPSEAGGRLLGDADQLAELAVRPLVSLLYPELSGMVQLLSGACGGRRTALERLPFHAGPGAQPNLLVELFELSGLRAIAQVDLQERLHGQRSLDSLAEIAYAVLQVFIGKLERRHGIALVEDIDRTMKLVRGEAGRLRLDLREVREQVRPPMVEIPEYVASRSGSGEEAWT